MIKIPGEYARVSHWSNCKDLIEIANKTPITIEDTISLVRLLEEHYFKVNDPDSKLYKYRIKLSFNRKYGLACFRAWEIKLPSQVLPLNAAWVTGYLRVGVVIHEFAHFVAIAYLQDAKHGRKFVYCQDEILKFWNENIRIEDKIAAGSTT